MHPLSFAFAVFLALVVFRLFGVKLKTWHKFAGLFIGGAIYLAVSPAAHAGTRIDPTILAAAKVGDSMLFLTDQKCGKGAAVWKAYQHGHIVDRGCYTLDPARVKIEPIGLPVGVWDSIDFETIDQQEVPQ